MTTARAFGGPGANGWSPLFQLESVQDGAYFVLKLADWTGGSRKKPSAVGYMKADGTLTEDIAEAARLASSLSLGRSVSVLDHGAIDDGDPANAATNTTAFAAALSYAISSGIKRISFPRVTTGRYCVTKASGYIFDVATANDIVFEGDGSDNGSTIVITWTPPAGIADLTIAPLWRLRDCNRPIIRGLAVDVAPKLFTQGIITAVNTNYIEFAVQAGYEPAFNSCDFVIGYSADLKQVNGWNFPCVDSSQGYALTDRGGGVRRIDFTTGQDPSTGVSPTLTTFWHGVEDPTVGQTISVVFRKRGGFTITGFRTNGLLIEDFRILQSPYGLMAGHENNDLTVRRLTVRGNQGDLYTAATVFNIASGRGTLTLEDCKADCLGDDFCNFYTWTWVGQPDSGNPGHYLPFTGTAGQPFVVAWFATAQDSGVDIPTPLVGDTIEIWPPDPSTGRTIRKVASVTDPGGQTIHAVTVTLDGNLPVGFDPATWWIFNRSQTMALRANRIEVTRSCGRVFLPYTDDAEIEDLRAEGLFGNAVDAFFPTTNDHTLRSEAGYSGGFSLSNATLKNNGQSVVDHANTGGLYFFMGTGIAAEPAGKLPDAKPVYIRNVLQDGTGYSGLTVVGHDAFVDDFVQKNIGTLRSGGSSSSQDNNNLYSSAGTITRGTLVDLGAGPTYATATGAFVDKVVTNPLRSIYSASETDAFIAKLSTLPIRTRSYLYDDFVRAILATGQWSKIKGLFLFAANDADAALRCINNPLIQASAVLAPTFTQDRGYTGDGATSYIDSEIAANVVGQDDIFAAVWCLNDIIGVTSRAIGFALADGSSGGDANFFINPRSNTNTLNTRANDGGTTSTANSNGAGFFAICRNVSGSYKQYINGGAPVTISTPSTTALSSADNFSLLRGSTSYSARQIAFACFGKAPADPDAFMASLYAAAHTFLQGVGAVA